MEKTLQKTANLLILNLQNIDNLGFLNGKTGIAVFLYSYSRNLSKPVYQDQADELLDDLFAALNMHLPSSLANGIAGIGFGLNYLIKNHFIETDENPDELFKNIDIRLSKDVGGQFLSDIQTNFPVFSAGFYALSRIKTENRTIQKNKLLSSLLEGIVTVYTKHQPAPSPMFTNSVIYFLNDVYDYGIYKEKVKQTLKMVLSYILNTFQTTTYRFTDVDILQNLLSSIKFYPMLVNDIQLYLNQLNLPPTNDLEIDLIVKDLQQYVFYPEIKCPYHSTSSMKKYIDKQIEDPSVSNLLTLTHIGMHLMGVKLS
jgi:hypothetical protein